MTSHLEEGTLHELLDGEIRSSELPPIQAHLAECGECRARLEEARSFQSVSDRLIGTLDQAENPAVPRPALAMPRFRHPWKRSLAWAATVVIAVGAGYYGRGPGPAVPIQQPTNVQAAVQEPATIPVTSPIMNAPPVEAPRRQLLADQPATLDAPVGKLTAAENKNERSETRSVDQLKALGMVSARSAAAKASLLPEIIAFPEALRRLGGTLRFIEGMVPDRIEALGQEVRVVYPLATGELVLTQRLSNGRVSHLLVAPAGFPADSLERLRARIRE